VLKFEGPAPPKGRNIVCRKIQFGWVQTHIPLSVVSGPKFAGLFLERGGNRSRSICFPILDILTRSGDIRDRILKLYEIGPNFACFGPPNSLGEGSPEFLDLRHKEHPDCDHVAKFHGDRPRKLGDLVAKIIKKKKHQSSGRPKKKKNKALVPGGLIMEPWNR